MARGPRLVAVEGRVRGDVALGVGLVNMMWVGRAGGGGLDDVEVSV